MSFSIQFRVRFAEIDLGRAVYFARYADFAHRCFEEFFTVGAKMPYGSMMETRDVAFPIVHTEADYFSPLRVDDSVRVEMEVTRLTFKSVTSRFSIFRESDNTKCAVISLKQACINTTFKPREMPQDIHALFAAHLVS